VLNKNAAGLDLKKGADLIIIIAVARIVGTVV
jgi:hypothetical protein